MKNKIILIGTVILAVVTVGCDNMDVDPNKFNQTYFPTNHWEVVGQGTNGQVIVEAKANNLAHSLQVIASEAVVPLTNGQPVRVELTIRSVGIYGGFKLIGSKAYPSTD